MAATPGGTMPPRHPRSDDGKMCDVETEAFQVSENPIICRYCRSRSLQVAEMDGRPISTSLNDENTTVETFFVNQQRPFYKFKPLRRWCREHPFLAGLTFLGSVLAIGLVLGLVLREILHVPTGILFNSGLVAIDHGDESQSVDLFFHHSNGQIRQLQYDGTSWSGGTPETNVLGKYAPPPRASTPLMAVYTDFGEETTKRIFYIDKDNHLQESIFVVGSKTWTQGTLGMNQYKASSSPNTGLTVCKTGIWQGDELSLALIYGGADGKNHMLIRGANDTAWHYNWTFDDTDSNSGCECTIRGSSRLDTWMISKNGTLQQNSFEYDLSSNSVGYPAGQWTSSTAWPGPLRSSTSISAIKWHLDLTTFVHIQDNNNTISEIRVATNASYPGTAFSEAPISSALAGTKIASVDLVTHPPVGEPGAESRVFFITSNNKHQITEFLWNFQADIDGWVTPQSPDIPHVGN